MASRKRPATSPSPSTSPPPHKAQTHAAPATFTTISTSSSTHLLPAVSHSVDPSLPLSPLPADIDMNRCPFTLVSASHNLLLTLLTQSNNTPHPWIKCHKCGKWRKLPPTLSALSPLLPSLPLTLQSLSSLSAPFLPFPFTCAGVHWDLDRRICSAIQDYQDIVHEWHQVPLRLVRANPRFDFYVALAHFLRVKGVTIREYPCIYGKSVDLFALYNLVHHAGGDEQVSRRGWWPQVYERLRLGGKAGQAADVEYLIEIYRSYFFEWQESKPVVFGDDSKSGGAEEGSGAAKAARAAVEEAKEEAKQAADEERVVEEVAVVDVDDEKKERVEPEAEGGSEMRDDETKEQRPTTEVKAEGKHHEADTSNSVELSVSASDVEPQSASTEQNSAPEAVIEQAHALNGHDHEPAAT